MRSPVPSRLRAVALSGVLGLVLAGALAGGAQTQALAAPEVVAAPTSPLAPPDGRSVDEVTRDASRVALARTVDLAAYRSALLGRQSDAISAQIAAIREIERRRVAALGYDPATTTDPREIARQMMQNKYGWGDDQFRCYDNIIMRESRWITTADNPHSSAYGIPQALPGSRMASAGADWRTNPATQITWGLGYVKSRFGTPCAAWAFKRAHGWY